MKSKASYLNTAIINENFKRFWPITAVATVFWFLFGPFQMMLPSLYGNMPQLSYMAQDVIYKHISAGSIILNLALPVALSVACFGYLHKSSSSNVMHAIPATRASLFVSNYLSGLLMSLIPMLINAPLVPLTMMLKVDINIGAAPLFRFIIEEFVIIFFVYAISVFAGMVAGNGVIHALTALAFNFLPHVMYALYAFHASMSYFGYSSGSTSRDMAMLLSPYSFMLETDPFSSMDLMRYLTAALLIFNLGLAVYRRRRLERAGDSYVFNAARYIIGFLFCFIASSVTAVLFRHIGILSYVIGFVIGFIFGQMIVNKTTKIFTKQSLKAGLIYALATVLIVGAVKLDLFGYERRVPQVSSVKSAELYYPNTLNSDLLGNLNLEKTESIEFLVSLHKEIVENRESLKSWDYYMSGEMGTEWLTIEYDLGSRRRISREYQLPKSFLRRSESLKALWECNESVASRDLISNLSPENCEIFLSTRPFGSTYIYEDIWYEFAPRSTDDVRKIRGLIEAVHRDINKLEFSDLFEQPGENLIDVSLYLRPSREDYEEARRASGNPESFISHEEYVRRESRYMNLMIDSKFVNTLGYIRELNLNEEWNKLADLMLEN